MTPSVHVCVEQDAREAARRAGPSTTADTCTGLTYSGDPICFVVVAGVVNALISHDLSVRRHCCQYTTRMHSTQLSTRIVSYSTASSTVFTAFVTNELH